MAVLGRSPGIGALAPYSEGQERVLPVFGGFTPLATHNFSGQEELETLKEYRRWLEGELERVNKRVRRLGGLSALQ